MRLHRDQIGKYWFTEIRGKFWSDEDNKLWNGVDKLFNDNEFLNEEGNKVWVDGKMFSGNDDENYKGKYIIPFCFSQN